MLCVASASRAQESDDKLAAYLSDPSFKVRLMAAIQIGKNQVVSAAPALRKALQDDNDTVKAAAALSLGQLSDQQARADLVGLLDNPKSLVFKAATKALGLLDRSNGRSPGFLVVVDEPLVPDGVPATRGQRLLRKALAKLAASPMVTLGAGEDKRIQGARMADHLKQRNLKGVILRPKLMKLSTSVTSSTTFSCKVSIMVVALSNNRMEFAGNGDADAEVEETGLDPDTIEDVLTQVLDASSEAAAEEALGYLARRTGP